MTNNEGAPPLFTGLEVGKLYVNSAFTIIQIDSLNQDLGTDKFIGSDGYAYHANGISLIPHVKSLIAESVEEGPVLRRTKSDLTLELGRSYVNQDNFVVTIAVRFEEEGVSIFYDNNSRAYLIDGSPRMDPASSNAVMHSPLVIAYEDCFTAALDEPESPEVGPEDTIEYHLKQVRRLINTIEKAHGVMFDTIRGSGLTVKADY